MQERRAMGEMLTASFLDFRWSAANQSMPSCPAQSRSTWRLAARPCTCWGCTRPAQFFHRRNPYFRFWRRCQEVISELPRPLVVIGDFNATQFSAAYKQLTSGDLRGAHVDRGRGSAVTWPNGRSMIPPIRIDHALLSESGTMSCNC